MAGGVFSAAVLGVEIDKAGRIGAAPWPVIPSKRPEPAELSSAVAAVEHQCAGLVGKEFRQGLEDLGQPLIERPQLAGRAADPVGRAS
jgi:hypothetical protein